MKFEKYASNLFQSQKVFPESIAKKILKIYKSNKSWKKINQNKPKHYSHVFKSNSSYLPGNKEIYIAKFYRSDKLRENKFITSSIKKYIIPKIEKRFNLKAKNIDMRCHKFKKDDYLRVHFDNYAGNYAITINLNENWKWDWGGLLCVPYGKNFSQIHALAPMWNTMNILTSKKGKESPHFVTSIQPFVKQERYTITLFVK